MSFLSFPSVTLQVSLSHFSENKLLLLTLLSVAESGIITKSKLCFFSFFFKDRRTAEMKSNRVFLFGANQIRRPKGDFESALTSLVDSEDHVTPLLILARGVNPWKREGGSTKRSQIMTDRKSELKASLSLVFLGSASQNIFIFGFQHETQFSCPGTGLSLPARTRLLR